MGALQMETSVGLLSHFNFTQIFILPSLSFFIYVGVVGVVVGGGVSGITITEALHGCHLLLSRSCNCSMWSNDCNNNIS